MSSSREFYRSSRDALPPIRDVLGDQLDRPARRDNPYSFDAFQSALPNTSSTSRSTRPQSGPTLPPIHSSRTQGYVTPQPLAPTPSASNPSYSRSHSSLPYSSHPHHAPPPSIHHAPPPSIHHAPPPSTHPSHPSAAYSFDVFRPSTTGLVHASTSSRSQGILRTTRIDAGRSSAAGATRGDDDSARDNSHKRYACEHCEKRFERPSSLKDHERVHSEAKPFQCPYPGCGKNFGIASNMRRHYRKVHDGGHAISGTGSADEEDGHRHQSSSGSRYASASGARGGYSDDTYMSSSTTGASGPGSQGYYTSSRR